MMSIHTYTLALALLGSVSLSAAEAVKEAPAAAPAAAPVAVVTAPAAVTAPAPAPVKRYQGTVIADKLNCRIAPSLDAAVGCVVKRDTVVEMTADCGNFIEIKAPASTKVYLSAVYLSGGKTIRELNCRTRPDPQAPVFMKLPAGTAVTKIADVANGWAVIAPPEVLRLYVARFYVKGEFPPAKKAEAAPVKAEEKKDAPAPAKVEEKKAAPAPAPVKAEEKKDAPAPAKVEEKKAAPAQVQTAAAATVQKVAFDAAKAAELKLGLKSLGIDLSQGTDFETTAVLTPLSRATTKFVQYSLRSERDELVAYASFPDADAVKELVGQMVKCRGKLYAVPNWRTKVLEVESITAAK